MGVRSSPRAGAVSPHVCGRPNRRFIHCSAPPAAPLVRLSMAHSTATVSPMRHRREVRVVAADDVLHPRRLGAHAHERRAGVVVAQHALQVRGVDGAREGRLQRHVDAARERTRVRHEGELRLDAARGARAGDDLRHVAVGERAVAVQVAVPQRVVRAGHGLATRAGAAGDPADEERRGDESGGQQRHARQQDRGGEAAGMGDVRRREPLEVFRERAAELREPARRAVRVAVDLGVRRRRAIAKIGRQVDHARLRAGLLGGAEQPIDQGRRDAVRRGREERRRRRLAQDAAHFGLGAEARLGIGAHQVREGPRHRLTRGCCRT